MESKGACSGLSQKRVVRPTPLGSAVPAPPAQATGRRKDAVPTLGGLSEGALQLPG